MLTLSGPAIEGCVFGQVVINPGANEVKFGPRVNMQSAWSVSANEVSRFGETMPFPQGSYSVLLDCSDERATQLLHPTPLVLTFVPAQPPDPPDPNSYRAVTPARVLDTRPGQVTIDRQAEGGGPVGPEATLALKVTGRGGVPESGVKAVVLNVTATAPSGAGFLTVYPGGEPRPLASNLNFAPGQTVANLVVAKVGAGGLVSIYNGGGAAVHLIADVQGWFPSTAAFTPLSPARLFDSRPGQTTVDGVGAGGGLVPPGAIRTVKVTDRGGVPATGVGAVILNVTATSPTGQGFVTVYPTGEARPLASNLNFSGGQTVANAVVAKVGLNGQVNLYNDTGSTHLIVDVAGWFPTTSTFHPLTPARLLDTRPGQSTVDNQEAGQGVLVATDVEAVKVTGRGGVAANDVGAVVLNLTVTAPSTGGFLTVYPTGELRPLASNLNFGPGQTVANLVITKVGQNGQVSIYNDTGTVHVIADVAGWFER